MKGPIKFGSFVLKSVGWVLLPPVMAHDTMEPGYRSGPTPGFSVIASGLVGALAMAYGMAGLIPVVLGGFLLSGRGTLLRVTLCVGGGALALVNFVVAYRCLHNDLPDNLDYWQQGIKARTCPKCNRQMKVEHIRYLSSDGTTVGSFPHEQTYSGGTSQIWEVKCRGCGYENRYLSAPSFSYDRFLWRWPWIVVLGVLAPMVFLLIIAIGMLRRSLGQ